MQEQGWEAGSESRGGVGEGGRHRQLEMTNTCSKGASMPPFTPVCVCMCVFRNVMRAQAEKGS